MSFSDTIQPVCPCITSAWGATASHSVHRATLIGLVMSEGDPSQLLWRKYPREGSTHLREHTPLSGVEEERFIPEHQELVEGEAGRWSDGGFKGRDPVNAVGDLIDAGLHDASLSVGCWSRSSSISLKPDPSNSVGQVGNIGKFNTPDGDCIPPQDASGPLWYRVSTGSQRAMTVKERGRTVWVDFVKRDQR
jgi:hypothetical protein